MAIERLALPEIQAWLVQSEGEDVAVYLLTGSTIHELRGGQPHQPATGDAIPPPTSRSEFSYRMTKLTADAVVSCRGTQTERGETVKEITENWRFDLGR